MTSILASHPPTRLPAVGDNFSLLHKGVDCRILCFGYSNLDPHIRTRASSGPRRRRIRSWAIFSGKLEDGVEGDDDDTKDDVKREDSHESGIGPVS